MLIKDINKLTMEQMINIIKKNRHKPENINNELYSSFSKLDREGIKERLIKILENSIR